MSWGEGKKSDSWLTTAGCGSVYICVAADLVVDLYGDVDVDVGVDVDVDVGGGGGGEGGRRGGGEKGSFALFEAREVGKT